MGDDGLLNLFVVEMGYRILLKMGLSLNVEICVSLFHRSDGPPGSLSLQASRGGVTHTVDISREDFRADNMGRLAEACAYGLSAMADDAHQA